MKTIQTTTGQPDDEKPGSPLPVNTVHLTWKNNTPPEDHFPEWWRRTWMQSGWTVRLWTDEDILCFSEEQEPQIRNLMEGYRFGVNRSDAFRYLLLKENGGLYVDLDFVCLRPMDWLLGFDAFSCADQGDGCLCNAFLWAPRAHDSFWDGIEEALLASAGEENPVSATGPRFLTSYSAGRTYHRVPTPWLYPVSWDDEQGIASARAMDHASLQEKFSGARAIHIWTKSWFEECTKISDDGQNPRGGGL